MIKFQCSLCNQKIEISNDSSGKDVCCPACNNTITVPSSFSSPLNIPQSISIQKPIRSTNRNKNTGLAYRITFLVLAVLGILLGAAEIGNSLTAEYEAKSVMHQIYADSKMHTGLIIIGISLTILAISNKD